MTLLMCLRAMGAAMAACLRYYGMQGAVVWARLIAFNATLSWRYVWACVAVNVVLTLIACQILWRQSSLRVVWTLVLVGLVDSFLCAILAAWLK